MNAPAAFLASLIGRKIAGRYIVDRQLGAGGMGVVAAGRYPELGQKVAIKFLRPEHAANPIVSARFLREARVAAKVKSAHFVRVFDVGRLESGVPYLVMELLEGCDLGDELSKRGVLPIEEAVDYVLQAVVGVAEIHALGIVHRDLKPSNLFLSDAAGTQIIKVLDFGISKESPGTKSVGAPLTSTSNVLGTPQYMSPEQVKASKDVDVRSDIWSLGVILYELLTGQLPFMSESGGIGEVFGKILYVDPVPPSVHRADLHPGLEQVILACLARDSEARYADVMALAEALRPFAASGSSHRIEAVRHALATRGDEDDRSDPDPRHSQAMTADSSPGAKRAPSLREGASPGGPSDVAAPVTSMTSSLVVAEGSRRRGRGVGLVVAALAVAGLAGGGALALASRKTIAPAPSVSSTAGAVSPAILVSSSAAVSAAPPAGAPEPALAASVAVSVAVPKIVPPVVATRPNGRASSTPRPGAAASSAKPGANDLILDRK